MLHTRRHFVQRRPYSNERVASKGVWGIKVQTETEWKWKHQARLVACTCNSQINNLLSAWSHARARVCVCVLYVSLSLSLSLSLSRARACVCVLYVFLSVSVSISRACKCAATQIILRRPSSSYSCVEFSRKSILIFLFSVYCCPLLACAELSFMFMFVGLEYWYRVL